MFKKFEIRPFSLFFHPLLLKNFHLQKKVFKKSVKKQRKSIDQVGPLAHNWDCAGETVPQSLPVGQMSDYKKKQTRREFILGLLHYPKMPIGSIDSCVFVSTFCHHCQWVNNKDKICVSCLSFFPFFPRLIK